MQLNCFTPPHVFSCRKMEAYISELDNICFLCLEQQLLCIYICCAFFLFSSFIVHVFVMTFLVQLIAVMSTMVVTQIECIITVKSGFGGVILGIYQPCQGLTWSCYSVAQSCLTLWSPGLHAARQASLSFTVSQSLLRLGSLELVMPSNHSILCYPLLLPSIFPSIRAFSRVGSLYLVARVLELQLQHQSFQWIFRTDTI